MEFFRRELESDGEEIRLSLISPWEKFIAYHNTDVKMLSGRGIFASSSALESAIPRDKSLGQLK